MGRAGRTSGDRAKSALAVALIHALLGYALVSGLGFRPVRAAADSLTLIALQDEPPPPPAVPARPEPTARATARPKDAQGAAAPPNRKDEPVEPVAPPPLIALPVPPVAVAPVAAEGDRRSAGAAVLPGPGTGAGGQGDGLGSGERGSGSGGGGGGGIARPARWLAGDIRDSDYPADAFRRRQQGRVLFRFTVAASGRVSDCTIVRSSGSAALDEATCRLVMRRFRYDPARDTAGRPVADTIRGDQQWWLAPQPPDQWYDAQEVRD